MRVSAKNCKQYEQVLLFCIIILTRVSTMAKREEILKSVDGYELSLAIYEAKNPKAIIQFIHGMEEYKERYDAFAEYLCSKGYTCVTSDLRGHGKSAPLLSHISNKKGDKLIIADQKEIRKYIKRTYDKDLPLYLFGHSMGTIISRVLMQTDGSKYSKVALSGYVNPNPVAGMGKFLTKCITCFKGPKGHSKFITGLAVGSFNKSIENPRTPLDWLSYNEENVDKYIADPLCGVEFTLGSYYALMSLLAKMCKARKYKTVDPKTPILLAAGKDDPCTGFEKGRAASKALLEKVGYKNIEVVTFDNMRHEILNEKDNQKVYKTFLDFYDK